MSELARFCRDGFVRDGLRMLPVDVPGDGNCLFHAVLKSGNDFTGSVHLKMLRKGLGLIPIPTAAFLRERLVSFAKCEGREFAEKSWKLINCIPSLLFFSNMDEYVDQSLAVPNKFASNFEMTLISALFQIEICCISNTAPDLMEFSTRYFIGTHLGFKEFEISADAETIFLFHHQYRKPLTPAPSNRMERLNHFLFLKPSASQHTQLQRFNRRLF